MKLSKILAIDPGSKEMGIAFLEGESELAYYTVKTFRCSRDPKVVLGEVRNEISRVIGIYKPNIFVLERLYYIQQKGSPLLKKVYQELKKIGHRNGLDVVELAPNTVRASLIGNGRATKLETAKVLAARFPHLRAFLIEQNRKRWQQKYWFNMFDAVALAVSYQQKINCPA